MTEPPRRRRIARRIASLAGAALVVFLLTPTGCYLSRAGWEEALANAVLTSPKRGVYSDAEEWRRKFEQASVIVQWDPERSLRGTALQMDSI